jgi:anti-anti-sigma regulatory factor
MAEQTTPAHEISDSLSALPADCGIAQAEALRGRLAGLRELEVPLQLDASAVERVSTACLQLLVALFRERAEAGRDSALQAPSAPLAEAIVWLGLSASLPIVAPDATHDEIHNETAS